MPIKKPNLNISKKTEASKKSKVSKKAAILDKATILKQALIKKDLRKEASKKLYKDLYSKAFPRNLNTQITRQLLRVDLEVLNGISKAFLDAKSKKTKKYETIKNLTQKEAQTILKEAIDNSSLKRKILKNKK